MERVVVMQEQIPPSPLLQRGVSRPRSRHHEDPGDFHADGTHTPFAKGGRPARSGGRGDLRDAADDIEAQEMTPP
jgi:hypothetical protein